MPSTSKDEYIEQMFSKGILLSSDALEKNQNPDLLARIESEADLLVLNEDYTQIINQDGSLVDWYELDRYRVDAEKDRDNELYQNHLQKLQTTTLIIKSCLSQEKDKNDEKKEIVGLEKQLEKDIKNNDTKIVFSSETEYHKEDDSLSLKTSQFQEKNPALNPISIQPSRAVTIVISFKNETKKYSINDFANNFVSRYRFLENILRHRQEMHSSLNISRVLSKEETASVSVIGLVDEIGETKSGNIIITLEDLTGRIKIIVSKSNKETYLQAKDLVLDEVIGVSGVVKEKMMFAENIIWPDIPLNNEMKKAEKEEYAIFLSDIHVGSKLFLHQEFEKFIQWLNGKVGNENQKEITKKIKYIFIAGDLVDGIGIYPSQQEELEIQTIEGQYQEFIRLVKKIPLDKTMILCPGNHDVVHLAEPQSEFYKKFVSGLYELPNVIITTNPSLVNIAKTETFSGFDVLMYHGYSFDYYVANVESIRMNGGYHRADLIMKFLLKRRHLAPSFRSTPYFPAHLEDPLLIKKIPDFFITGHIHYSCVANYKGITMISGSCWQNKTSFQEKMGHEPEPGRVPLVNLKTREIKILRFV